MRVKTFDDFSDGLDVRKPKNLDNDESLRTLVNAYITQGETIERRPGLKFELDMGRNLKNLCAFDGRLHTFTVGTQFEETLSNGVKLIGWKISYDAGKACQPDPVDAKSGNTDPEPVYVNFVGGFLSGMYVSVKWDNGRSLHYFIENPRKMYSSTVNPISDSGCPHTSKVAIAQSKIYAVGDTGGEGDLGQADTVRYSATANYSPGAENKPVWTKDNDAGFLPTGDRSLGNSAATGLGVVSNRLVVFHEDACQIWAVDPDPARNELEEQVAGIGTEHYQSIVTANKDIYFLSSVGVRSIGGQSMYRNMKGSDVGSAIDKLIMSHIKDHDGRWDGQFYPGAGQYWLTAGNETFVLTKSQRDKLNAWSVYRFSQSFYQMAHLAENLYCVNGTGFIYRLDEETLADGKDEKEFTVEMETPFYSFGQEGQFKLFQSMEVILEGFGEIDHCVNPNNNDDRTAPFQIAGDTRTVPTLPLGILAPTLSTRIKGNGSELKSINSLIYRYQPTNAGV